MTTTNFAPKDIFIDLIINKLRWTPIGTAIFAFFWTWLNASGISVLGNRFFEGIGYRSFLLDYFHHFSTLLYAVVWGYFVWVHKAPLKVVKELESSAILSANKLVYQKAGRMIQNKFSPIFSAIIALCACSLNFYQDFISNPSWLNASTLLLVSRYVLLILPTTYAVIITVIRLITNAFVFRLLLKDVKLYPLHPDKAGGLHPLGSYALKTTYPIALAGSVAAAGIYWSYLNGETYFYFYLASFVYVILAPIVFFAPLSSAHTAMLKAKKELIEKISTQFNKDYPSAYQDITGSAAKLKNNLEKLEQLRKLHDMANSFPVWPFDVQTVRQFILTMLSPIFTVLLSIAANFFSNILIP